MRPTAPATTPRRRASTADEMAQERRPATQEEARALSHPLRLRILRLCLDEDLTNKELAARLHLHPATVLHHVRTLVATGFLREQPPRPGARGTVEKPYRATGKSWRLDVADRADEAQMHRAMLDALAAEITEAGDDSVLTSARMAMRLQPGEIDELVARVRAIVEEYANRDDPDGEPVAMLALVHRRPAPRREGEADAVSHRAPGTPTSRRRGTAARTTGRSKPGS